jgi:hypothetical protein
VQAKTNVADLFTLPRKNREKVGHKFIFPRAHKTRTKVDVITLGG